VPLVAAAVCPHPPLLVPRLASGAAAELDGLRTACGAAVTALLDAEPETIMVIGSGQYTAGYGPGDHGSLAAYGVPVTARLGRATPGGRPGLPLSLIIGGWLLGPVAGVRGQAVRADTPAADCAALGRSLAAAPGRTAFLVMGDGSARRSERAPGHLDQRAEAFDTAAAEALAKGDTDTLLGIDQRLAAELWCAGRAPWQVLAGAAALAGTWRGDLRYDSAPYGVAYLVASWTPMDAA
jgi:hypothetical protein